MFDTIELPTWFVAVAAVFASIAAIERALIPSVRWFFRRRMERVVAKVNQRLDRPIEPFQLARRHEMSMLSQSRSLRTWPFKKPRNMRGK